MKYSLLLVLSVSFLAPSRAQLGCTDPAATNYNAAATTNDGSCLYPVTHGTPVLRAALPVAITESSGLVFTDGKLWSHNDSGNPADIFSIDTTTGAILQTVHIDNYANTDWEDLSADSNYIYIDDCGNNNGDRTDLKILKIAKADIGSAADVHVNAQAINISYTDQTSFSPSSTNNFDCESIVAIRDSIYLFTKDRGDQKSRVYKVCKTPGTYQLSPYSTLDAGGLVTGADYNPTTNEVVLIGYLSDHTHSFLWFLNDFSGDMFFSGNKRRIEIGTSAKWQTEGVCYQSNNRLFVSCETLSAINASLYTVDKTWNVPNSVANTKNDNNFSLYPNPAGDVLHIHNPGKEVDYSLLTIGGQKVMSGILPEGDDTLNIKSLTPGNYALSIRSSDGKNMVMKVVKH